MYKVMHFDPYRIFSHSSVEFDLTCHTKNADIQLYCSADCNSAVHSVKIVEPLDRFHTGLCQSVE